MAFFKLRKTEAERAQQRVLQELERVAKAQRKHAAKEHKAQQTRLKQQSKEARRAEKLQLQQQKEARKSHQRAVKTAKKASKTRIRLARKAEKERARRHRRQMRHARAEARRDGGTAPAFAKSTGCYVCGKKFAKTLHRRRHHCRQCRESCCLQCTSRTRRPVPLYGLDKPQKVCVVCETLVLNNEATASAAQPREPAEAVVALAASDRASRRPHSAPLPPTEGVTVAMTRGRGRGRARSTKSKGASIWTLPIRPLLKRKKSAEQLRNRKMDLDLQVDKRLLFGGRAVELQPQSVAPPAP
ncbi:hypothetical protein PF005_g7913 [Phytophthora fragariae]|uniref:FYVE-type domain-containing protein n=1 Tax=Phytophthora fragariae TaxID=53985 RepID=A0A6A3SM34_9STRA|nr:hypothetical protein PF003_g5977 [Phytophthora fragariae]KAE8941225.1 hypothetical protein PF009_g8983 [Phytophthora fragariae]KAE9016644.1 hypothetical protein PF011_g7064 [Phytophthora fragariae]KAE9119826.1 hypothetical protein PF007_g8399 [Phytophthora fragariae]KAE9120535.1 hypothetical protein PF010_g7455 [Phytophthora fragariae]